MTDSEKLALWTLGVLVLTTTAYFIFVMLLRDGPATISVFALLALVSVRRRRLHLDEREKEIAHRALLVAFRAMWFVVIGLFVMLGFVKGWDTTLSLPMWKLSAAITALAMLMMAVQSAATLVLYRRGSNAP